ncbi:MAG TPA: phosphotransferase [Propionibacteriaceae bacterium]
MSLGRTAASGQRITWTALPDAVRGWVEEVVGGGPVVVHQSQMGGFSPGTADRIRTADGHRAFVKAVSPTQNPRTPDLHRQEAQVVALLPDTGRTPRLLGVYDDGFWVALVFEDVAGHTPSVPWIGTEVAASMTALAQLAADLTPSPAPQLGPVAGRLREPFGGWARIRADRPRGLDDWSGGRLDELVTLAEHGLAAVAGDTLVHSDIRADNLLVGADHAVTVVDWPWAATGADWVDQLMLVVNVDLYGGHDPESLLAQYLNRVPDQDVTAVLAGMCGYFSDAARQPAPVGLPTVRAFQAAQADSTRAWLRRRLGS